MPTLKELIDQQKLTGKSDIEIISDWFCQKNREEDGLDLISNLNKSKVNKLSKTIDYVRTWLPCLPDVYEANKGKITKEHAKLLNQITRIHLLGNDLSDTILNTAKEVIPTIDTPSVIFIPMVEWLKDKYQIEFKDKRI